MKLLKRYNIKGQTVIETVFVFGSIIFLAFTMINFAIMFHTKSIATYAAFMSARSYQVLGDQQGMEMIEEVGPDGQVQPFLNEFKDKTLATVRVAEDIFTCSLPWMKVPEGDGDSSDFGLGKKTRSERCQEGERKYQTLNVGKTIKFDTFKDDSSFSLEDTADLVELESGFAETGRKKLRFGIMSLKYRSPVLSDPMALFTKGSKDGLMRDQVFVPVILNPHIESGIQKQDSFNKGDFDDDFEEK